MEEWIKLSAPIKKIGNSYSVRIPINIVKDLKLKEGNIIGMKLKKLEIDLTTKILDNWFKKARKIKELKKFTDDKIYLFSRLAHNEGKVILESNYKKYDPEKITNQEAKKMVLTQKKYKDKVKKDFGKKLFEEYLFFRKHFDKYYLSQEQ